MTALTHTGTIAAASTISNGKRLTLVSLAALALLIEATSGACLQPGRPDAGVRAQERDRHWQHVGEPQGAMHHAPGLAEGLRRVTPVLPNSKTSEQLVVLE